MNAERTQFSLTGIENEKQDLLNYLENAKGQVELMPHPFFGKLNRQEWARLIYKHLDHHLNQFGSR